MPPRKAAKPAAPPSDEIRSSPPAAEPVKPKRAPASKKRVVVASEDEDDAPGEPLVAPELNEADHTHKPMTTDAFHRTAGLARDLKEQASRYTAGVETLSRAAADLIEASGGELSEARAKALADIELKIRRLLDRAHDARLAMEAITDIRNRLGRNEAITHAYDDFETQLVDPRAEYAGKTSRQRYAEAEPYVDYRTTIWVRWRSARRRTDLQNADKTKAGGMPSVKSLIPTEEGDDSDDDDIEVGGTTQRAFSRPSSGLISQNCCAQSHWRRWRSQ